MFKRPEEIIVFILALLWVGLSYYLAAFLGADAYTVIKITVFTLIWAAVCFRLWQRNLSSNIWPLMLGFLTACWWPYLDWLAVKDIIAPDTQNQTIVITRPWYAGWLFKSLTALVPVCAGYAFKWRQNRKRKLSGQI